jgi:hypothetical protein
MGMDLLPLREGKYSQVRAAFISILAQQLVMAETLFLSLGLQVSRRHNQQPLQGVLALVVMSI